MFNLTHKQMSQNNNAAGKSQHCSSLSHLPSWQSLNSWKINSIAKILGEDILILNGSTCANFVSLFLAYLQCVILLLLLLFLTILQSPVWASVTPRLSSCGFHPSGEKDPTPELWAGSWVHMVPSGRHSPSLSSFKAWTDHSSCT